MTDTELELDTSARKKLFDQLEGRVFAWYGYGKSLGNGAWLAGGNQRIKLLSPEEYRCLSEAIRNEVLTVSLIDDGIIYDNGLRRDDLQACTLRVR